MGEPRRRNENFPNVPQLGDPQQASPTALAHDGRQYCRFWAAPSSSLRSSTLGLLNRTVEMIRIEADELNSWSFLVNLTGAQISMNAVPDLDNGGPNQDFALYVYNAKLASAG